MSIVNKILSVVFVLLPSTAIAQERVVFSPQWMPQSQFAGYYVAKEMGFYKEEGLDVEILHPSTSQSVLSYIRSGESQITMMQLSQAMQAIDNGIPLVNVLQTSMNTSELIVSRHNKSPLSLHGARVAKWTNTGYMAMCMSEKEGLDYQWVHITMSISLFVKGALDAMACLSYNELNQLKQSGMTIPEESICWLGDHGYNMQEDGCYMTRDYYLKHKEQAEKFARASIRGWEWTNSHQEEALDIVMKYIKDRNIGTNRVMQRLMLKEVLRLQIDKESKKREYRVRPDMVELANRLMVECKLLKHEVKYEQLISK